MTKGDDIVMRKRWIVLATVAIIGAATISKFKSRTSKEEYFYY